MWQNVLCIDVGTTRLKAIFFDHQASILSQSEYFLHQNQDYPLQLQKGLVHVFRALSTSKRLDCIVISGNGPSLFPIDKDGGVMEPVLPWYDSRRREVSGQMSHYLPKAKWFCLHANAHRDLSFFLPLPEYLAFILGANPVHVVPSAEYAPYIWDSEGISAYQLDDRHFPPQAHIFDVIGNTSKRAALQFAIPSNVPIICSGIDYLMSLVGTNTLAHGLMCDRTGTSEGVNYCLSNLSSGGACLPHVVPKLYTLGTLFHWSGTIFYQLLKLAATHGVEYPPIGNASVFSEFILPSMQDSDYRHYEKFFSTIKSYKPAKRKSYIQALMFQMASLVSDVIQLLGAQGYRVTPPIRMSGGQCLHDRWVQYKCNCIGVPIQIAEIADAELLGSLCVALCVAGEFSDLAEAASALVKVARVYEPQ